MHSIKIYLIQHVMIQTCGLTTYCPFVADRMSRECSNSLVIDSMVLAGLGNGDAGNTGAAAEG